MKRSAALPGALLIIVLAVSAVATLGQRQQPRSEDEYIEAINRGLDVVMSKLRAASDNPAMRQNTSRPLIFSANLMLAHGAFVKHVPLDALLACVDSFKEAGARRIDINPSILAWTGRDTATIAKYDALIDHIRKVGLQLAWNPEFNKGDVSVARLDDWKRAALPVYTEWASRYRPDIFVVIHEPTTMAGRMGINVSRAEWQQFVRDAAAAVHPAGARTRVGAGALPAEFAYFKEWSSLDGLDVLSLDLYNLGGLETANRMIGLARRSGKGIYIEETWRFPYMPPSRKGATLESMSAWSIGEERYSALDVKWLETMTLYARVWGLEAITPSWTQTFFKYLPGPAGGLDPAYNGAVIQAALHHERTSTFRAYQALASKYGGSR